MPRRTLRQLVGISPHTELLIMALLGTVRNAMNWFSFTWDGNVQAIWNLPGPEPSFTAKYHIDYWLKTIVSCVVLFRNYTTHLHLIFYIVMLYPVFTGDRHRLMLPWLYLQMMKNIVSDVICTIAGLLLCWILHSCGLLAVEFLIVRIISMMPSIYLWRRLRSYYFELYYAELDGVPVFPMIKPRRSLTLAQRRRASKSLDGKIPRTSDPNDVSGMNYSCLTYNEFFGEKNWEIPSDHKISKSLTTLLSIESQDSDDVDDDSRLHIIDDANLTPAEKTRKILGLTHEEVEATTIKLHKKPSTDLNAAERKPSTLSVSKEAVEPRTAATQVEHSISGLKNELIQSSRRCICCEETMCSKEDDQDFGSSASEAESTHVIVASGIAGESVDIERERSSGGKSSDCCGQDRHDERKSREKEDGSNNQDEGNSENGKAEEIVAKYQLKSNTVTTAFGYHTHDSCLPTSCIQAIVHKDRIVWENLKEINFVSEIKKMLYDEFKPFKLHRICLEDKKSRDNAEQSLKCLFKEIDWRLRLSCGHEKEIVNSQSDHRCETMISEREDSKFPRSSAAGNHTFLASSSISFGINADISALKASHVLEKKSISGVENSDSTPVSKNKSSIPSQEDVPTDSFLISSYSPYSHMIHNPTTELEEDFEKDITKSTILPQGHHDHKASATSRVSLKIEWENSEEKIYSLSLLGDESISSGPMSPTKDNEKFPRSSKISPIMTKKNSVSRSLINRLPKSDQPSAAVHSNSESRKMIEIDKSTVLSARENEPVAGVKSSRKDSRCRDWMDQQSPTSSLGSGKIRKFSKEWELKAIEALKAYNEKTIFKYKREMDARKQHERPNIVYRQDDAHDPRTRLRLSKQSTVISCSDREDAEPSVSPASTRRSHANQILYVPSVPEIETPERELMWKIDNAYARFTRSKPIAPSILHGKRAAKDFVEMYSGGGRLKTESKTLKIHNKAARKQHSKYSKSDRGGNAFDVSSKSCKRIEGSQKGRDLDRTTAKANFRDQEIEVYFFERYVDDKPTTSKDVSITTIKSFVPKRGVDTATAGSSEISIADEFRSPIVEVLTTPEEIPRRIEDNEYYVQFEKKNGLENVREAIKRIDWSCGWLDSNEIFQRERNELNYTIVPRDHRNLEQQDIMYETTEKMLQSAFAHSESSERGFHLGERANEFYPIFNNISITIGEIVKAAALRGYRNEFFSQPAREIEIPEISDADLYNLVDPLCSLQRRSSSRQFLGFNVSADTMQAFVKRSPNDDRLLVANTIVSDNQETVFRAADFGIPRVDDEQESLLDKIITSVQLKLAEVNAASLRLEVASDELNDTSPDVSIPQMTGMQDYSKSVLKGLSIPKKLPTSSRRHNSERSLRIGSTPRRSCERERLALKDVIHESPDTIQGTSLRMRPFADNEESQFEFDVTSCQRILNHFNSGGREMQNLIVKIFDQLPSCKTFTRSEDPNSQFRANLDEGLLGNLRGPEFVTALQMLTNFQLTKNTAEKIINVSDDCGESHKTSTQSTQNNSVDQNRISQEQAVPRTSHALKNEHLEAKTSTESNDFGRKEDQEVINHRSNHQVVIDTESNPDSRVSSAEKIDESYNDEGKKLLANILETESEILPSTPSELLRRTNFRRNLINSMFYQAVEQNNSMNRFVFLQKGTKVKKLEAASEDMTVETAFLTSGHTEPNDFNPPHSKDVDVEANIPELWIATDEQSLSRNVPEDKFFIGPDDAMSEKILRNVESAECVNMKIKTVFEEFHVHGNSHEDQVQKCETPVDIDGKVTSVTNLRFPENGELQKLHNLMQLVVNYAMITECSSGIFSSSEPGQSTSSTTKTSQQSNNSNVQRKEFNKDCTTKISGNLEEESNTLPGIDGLQAIQDPGSRLRSSQNGSRHKMNRFSSWDRMIPSSTRLQLAKSKRKSRAKKVVTIPEPSRRVIKVDKLIAQKNLDFFSARYVPQRGRALSSGYLMDSDSDGNFTVSRPLTPSSVESATSQSLSWDIKQPDVFSDSLKASDILPSFESSQHPHVTDLPKDICLSSSSRNRIGETVLPENALDLMNNLLLCNSESKSHLYRNEMIETQQSSEMPSSLVVVEPEIPSLAESVLPEVIGAHQSAKDLSRDEKSHELVTKILPTKSELNRMSPIYSTRIEDKLKDVMQQILNHQFSGVEPQIPSPSDSKIGSFISVSSPTKIAADPEAEVQKQNRMKEECQKKFVDILDRSDDTPIDKLIAHLTESVESISETSDNVPVETAEPRSRISLRHVGIGTEYNVEVYKDLLHLFNKLLTVGNNLKPVTTPESEEFNHVNNRLDVLSQLNVHPLINVASESDRNMPGGGSPGAIPPFDSSDEIYLKGTSNSSRIDLSLDVPPTKDLDSTVKLLHLQSFREEYSDAGISEVHSHEDVVNSTKIEQVKFTNFLEKLDSPGSAFHSYDSFASLSFRNTTDASELLSREISISNHTFLEEFPEQLESDINSLPKSSKVTDKRSSESMKSEFGEDETSLKQQTSVVSSDTNGSHLASASTSSSKCDAEPKKDAVPKKSAIPRPMKNSKGSRET